MIRASTLAAIHFREIKVEKDKIRSRGIDVGAFPPQKCHGLHAVGDYVQMDGLIRIAKGLSRQADIAWTVASTKELL